MREKKLLGEINQLKDQNMYYQQLNKEEIDKQIKQIESKRVSYYEE